MSTQSVVTIIVWSFQYCVFKHLTSFHQHKIWETLRRKIRIKFFALIPGWQFSLCWHLETLSERKSWEAVDIYSIQVARCHRRSFSFLTIFYISLNMIRQKLGLGKLTRWNYHDWLDERRSESKSGWRKRVFAFGQVEYAGQEGAFSIVIQHPFSPYGKGGHGGLWPQPIIQPSMLTWRLAGGKANFNWWQLILLGCSLVPLLSKLYSEPCVGEYSCNLA